MSTAVEAIGFVICLISWLATGVALANDYWKISSVHGDIIISIREFQNLWHACAENSAGMAECRDFESMLNLPVYVQACRALMIIALLLGLCSMIVALLGVKCIKIGSANDQSKAKLALAGGLISILAGLCTMTAISWYANSIVQEFHDPYYGGVRYEIGAGLYIGWTGGLLALLGGGLLCCVCRRLSPQQGVYPAKGAQKVYKAVSDPDKPTAYV